MQYPNGSAGRPYSPSRPGPDLHSATSPVHKSTHPLLLIWDESYKVCDTVINTKLREQSGNLSPMVRLVIEYMHQQSEKIFGERFALHAFIAYTL